MFIEVGGVWRAIFWRPEPARVSGARFLRGANKVNESIIIIFNYIDLEFHLELPSFNATHSAGGGKLYPADIKWMKIEIINRGICFCESWCIFRGPGRSGTVPRRAVRGKM